jgi:predicted metal-dependent phosphoesterase TrpH
MLIDLHTHTYPCSPCSTVSAEALIVAAMRCGVDAICVTDHHFIWGAQEAQALARERYGFIVFRGVEARTTLGDMLIFGLDEDTEPGMDGEALLQRVNAAGGAAVSAHPFRKRAGWSLWYWLEQRELAVGPELLARPELVGLHAIETFNGAVDAEALARAEDLARVLGLPETGGSDAHSTSTVGQTATEFARPVTCEADLVREIREGRIRPRRLRR